jgi:hypothetical protein
VAVTCNQPAVGTSRRASSSRRSNSTL